MTTKDFTIEKEILNHAISGLSNVSPGVYACDLHNELFNIDYFIIGYYKAEQFLINCKEGVFGAIELIKNYEQDNFGQVSTDFSNSEKVANMYAYIKGEELLNTISLLSGKWNEGLSQEDLDLILEELNEIGNSLN